MSRTDTYLDGILRHLGAAYYDSLHGRASQADVRRAVDSVAEHFNEDARPSADGTAPRVAHESRTGQDAGVHGWSRRVGDVMATSVVTVDRATPTRRSPGSWQRTGSAECLC